MRCACTLAVSLTLAGCGIPTRDNPHDPLLAPEAIVRVYIRQADGTDVEGTQGSQQTLFVFDASESFDSRGDGELSFAWDLTDPRWDVGAVDDYETASNEGPAKLVTALPLTRTMLAHDGVSTGVGFAPREVRLRVKTARGSRDYAAAEVLLHNDAPVVDPGGPLTVSPTALPPVILDACGGVPRPGCTSSDPDGDPVTFTWEQVRGEPVALETLDEDGARVRFQPADALPLEFKVTADDGVATSVAYVPVRFEAQVWVSTDSPPRLYRVHPELAVRTSYRAPGPVALSGLVSVAASRGDIGVGRSDGTVLLLDRDFRRRRSWVLPERADRLVLTSEGGACATGGSGFHALSPDGSTDAHADPLAVRVLRAPSGCWTIGTTLGRFEGGVWSEVAATGTLRDGAVLPDGTLFVVSTSGSLLRLDPGVPGPVALAVPFVPEALSAHPDGVSLLAAEALTGAPWRVAKNGAADVDDVPAAGEVDPFGGAIWEVSGAEVRHHRLRDGVWVQEAPALHLADVTGSSGAFTAVAADLEGDSLVGIRSSLLVRLPSHLTRSRLVASFPDVPRATADPSSGAVWVDAGAGLERWHGGRLVARAAEPTWRSALALPGGDVWADAFDGSYSLVRVDRYGAEQARVSLDDRAPASLDLAGSTLCVATQDYTGNGPLLRVELGNEPTVVPLTVDMDGAMAAAAAPDGTCWFAGVAGYGQPDHRVRVPAGSTTASENTLGTLACEGRLVADPRGGVFGPCAGGAQDIEVAAHCTDAADASCLDRWMAFFDGRVRLSDGGFALLDELELSLVGNPVDIEVAP